MGCALVWAVGGPRPWPRPLVGLLWAYWILGGFDFASLLEWFDLVTSLVGLWHLCPCTVLGWPMASLSVHCSMLAAPLAAFVMSLGWLRSMPA